MDYLSRINGQSGAAALKALIDKRGPLTQMRPVPEDLIAPRLDVVPNLLIDLWRFHGVGALEQGAFWLPMPGELDAIIALLFQNDVDFAGDTYPVAYGAMGNLLCWSTRHGPVLIALRGGTVQAPGLFEPDEHPPTDEQLLTYLSDLDPFFFDAVDGTDEPMLARAKDRLDPLKPEEVYATFPILPAPGGPKVEDVEIALFTEYLGAVVQSVGFVLRDYKGGNFNVREIGGGAL